MTTLFIKFIVRLEDQSISQSSLAPRFGPLFHRWLPDGKKNALKLSTTDPKANLMIWFERRGYVDDSFIRFDYNRKEVDPKIMEEQGILEAGPLFGLLEIQGISKKNLDILRMNKVGHDLYISLGKRVVKLICPLVQRFLNILRINYGQYWIAELDKWDSRRESLGNYCGSELSMQWRTTGEKTWKAFEPDEKRIKIVARLPGSFSEYLTEENWQELVEAYQKGYGPSAAAFVLSRAHQSLKEGNIRQAFVEGTTAIEIALHEFIRNNQQASGSLPESMQAFWTLPMRSQLIIVLTILGNTTTQQIEEAVKAVKIRNDIVHEGKKPPAGSKDKLSILLRLVASIVSGPKFKFPKMNIGNAKMSHKKWKKREKKKLG
jgi:hypothetical protein